MGKSRIIGRKSAGRRSLRGSALVESAILLPLMLLMLFGTMDFGRVFFTGIAVASAARAGVQFGSLNPGNAGNATGIQTAAQADAANQGLVAASLTITPKTFCQCVADTSEIACSSGTCTGGSSVPPLYVEVTAAYTFTTLVNWPGVPRTTTITRIAKMRVQ
jgi:Flp pilus assembly protein TadG